jgi:hypothetical protein
VAQSNAAAPILDFAKKAYGKLESITGDPSKKTGEKEVQGTGKLPDAWEDANRKSVQQALDSEKPVGKKAVQKPSKIRTAPLANKRVARKRSQ